MKHLFLSCCFLSLTMCATLTPEQAAERRMRWNRVLTAGLEAGFRVVAPPTDPGFRK